MKAILYTPRPRQGRFKLFIPYPMIQERQVIKAITASWYHCNQKLWSLPNNKENLQLIKQVLQDKFIEKSSMVPEIPPTNMSAYGEEAVAQLEGKLLLKAYSPSTIKTYCSNFRQYLSYFSNQNLRNIEKHHIESFVTMLIRKYRISESKQNQMINAIKAYYEHVLGQPRTYYDIQRPKKALTLPNVISRQEVKKLLEAPVNLKHKAMLYATYSGGLRCGEVLQLRIEDIRSEDGYIFIKGAKGKKDRRTVLSERLLDLLRIYYKEYKPAYWLFEGASGEKYSRSSLAKVFRRAAQKSEINPWVTLHTLRHSFATHLLEGGTSMRHLQILLGHNSAKTTQIYTHVLGISNKTLRSPLDLL